MSEDILDKLHREHIKLASLNKRLWAYSLDEIIVGVIFSLFYNFNFGVSLNDPEAILNIANNMSNIMSQLFIMFLYWNGARIVYQIFFIWYYGATIGKILLRIEVIDVVMLSKPNLADSLLRACAKVIGEMAFYLGFIWALGNPQRQAWHDRLAKTVVCDAF